MKTVISYNTLLKLSFALSFILLLGQPQKSVAQEVITIQQAIEETLHNNLQIKQAKLTESLSDENLSQAKNALLPTLNGSGSFNTNFGRSLDPSTQSFNSQKFSSFNGGVSTSVTVFQGFQKLNQIKQNKLLLDADKTNVEKIKNDLVLQVVTAYMQILYNKDFLQAAKQQLTVAQKQLKQQQELLDVGNKTLADLAESKSQVATAELDVTTAENALTISYLTLAQLMDIPSSTKYQVKAPDVANFENSAFIYDPEQVYTDALSFFPDIKLAGLRSEAAKKGITIAKGNYYPSLSFGAGLNSNYSSGRQRITSIQANGFKEIGRTQTTNEAVVTPDFTTFAENYKFKDQLTDNFGQYVGVRLEIPIFNGFTARSSVRKAKINYQQNQTDEQLTKNNLNKVIYQAVADLKAARSTFESSTRTFNARKEAFSVIEQRYNVGLVNALDYSTSQTNKNKAEIDMIRAKYDLLFKAKVIDYYLGKQIVF
ncbi:TolC family protein [Pedobacter heparinus]|uniref:Outer membrane efflux protein n=1 Tax=Pedobacter heparinus (strain ATCC 13125 / DSM 2366 / CIP 104194 / JCM 7457 / NBRC 12017 / NCIMB 9290 / NRRL B-14731 / HIM 762-3) TaxID=485917 RepID=C6Y1A8_PEDHD|nr:TolC family protein [Pedobacter heparinus]ACU02884.1 outer membrane efflux protein [Pedobacter heparinus DSM 2366]